MLGSIVLREDILYLYDDPVLEPDSTQRNLNELTSAIAQSGCRRIVVTGASHNRNVDLSAIEELVAYVANAVPADTRFAFAHSDFPEVRALATIACELMEKQGLEARSFAQAGDAVAWLRSSPAKPD